MSKYIDAEKLIAKLRKHLMPTVLDREYDEWEHGKDSGLHQAIGIIESLQQEQPEVELEKAIDDYYHENLGFIIGPNDTKKIVEDIARHFYKLGLNARKKE